MSPVAVYRQGARTRDPWPKDLLLTIGGETVGFMVAQAKATSAKPPDLGSVQPGAFTSSAQNPVLGKEHVYGAMPFGMGLRQQRASDPAEDLQYAYTIAADWSSGALVKGPDITMITPTTTDSTNGGTAPFFELDNVLYAPIGQYVLKRTGDDATAWTVSRDLGTGTFSYDAVSFRSNALSAGYAFVALGNGANLYHLTGSTWTQHASMTALAFARTGREFYRAHTTNTLSRVFTDADPTNAANWINANAFYAGDGSSAIVRLGVTASGTLLVFKTDGVYTLDEAGEDTQLFPHLRLVPSSDNGKGLANWGNELYVPFGLSGLWRIDAEGASIEQCGPELMLDNGGPVKGYVTATVGSQWGLYGAFYDPDSTDSYLCKFLGMTERNGRKAPIWHGSLSSRFASEKITALHRSGLGASTGHTRVYLHTNLGRVGWFTLSCQPNPADCASYRFSGADGEAYPPTWTGGFGSDYKALTHWSATQRGASGAAYLQLQYRTDASSGAYTVLPASFLTDRQKTAFPAPTSAVQLDQKIVLKATNNTSTPIVQSFAVHHGLQTSLKQVRPFNVICEDSVVDRAGTALRIGQAQIRAYLQAASNPETSPGTISAVLPDESQRNVRVIAYGEQQVWDDRSKQVRAVVPVQLIDVSDITVYGTYGRLEGLLTYGTLEGLGSYGAMESI